MSPRLTIAAFALLVLLMFGGRFFHSVPAGHVGVADLFGEVQDEVFTEGLKWPVNPFYKWRNMDVRQQSHKVSLDIPTRDQLLSAVDLSIQYRLDGSKAPMIFRETGDESRVIGVHLIPVVRSKIREIGTKIPRAEELFQDEIRDQLANELLKALEPLRGKGLIVETVLIRGIKLPPVLADAIEKKKEREQAVERQRAELERFRLEQAQQVAQAEAARQAAEEEAKRRRVIADAQAYEIEMISKAASGNPVYIQLQAIEALKQISKDPSAKLYFIDGNSPQPLPLLHMGDDVRRR